MAEILHMDGITFLPETPKSLLQKAKKWDMERCIIIGQDKDGEMVFGGSFAEAGNIVLLLELAKKFVLEHNIGRQM